MRSAYDHEVKRFTGLLKNFLYLFSVLCNLQPDTDSCGLQSRQYFYNATSQRCERFIHGGCDRRGSDNRFDRLRDCQGTCNGVVDVCATISCPAGTRCTIDINSGTPYCDPSCEYENGGCSDDEICKMRPVYCITTPCPEFVECLPRKGIYIYCPISCMQTESRTPPNEDTLVLYTTTCVC